MSEREEILECAIDDLTGQVNERDQILREKEARIARLELRIKGVIEIIQENDVTKHLEKEIIQALEQVLNYE